MGVRVECPIRYGAFMTGSPRALRGGSLPGGYAVRPQCHVRSSHDPRFLTISFQPPFFLSFSTVCPISITSPPESRQGRCRHRPPQRPDLPARLNHLSTARKRAKRTPFVTFTNPCRVVCSIGVVLAIGSGVLIGSSFVFKKKGLLRAQRGHVAGEGVAYLQSVRMPLLWYIVP